MFTNLHSKYFLLFLLLLCGVHFTFFDAVGGWLKKKAGHRDDKAVSSIFNKGTWQKRWFVIEDEITGDENYELCYYHTPDDRKPRQIYPLKYANVVFTGGEAFQLTLEDGTVVHLACEREDIKE